MKAEERVKGVTGGAVEDVAVRSARQPVYRLGLANDTEADYP